MKKTIKRNGVFETNSSSSHSISIRDIDEGTLLDTLEVVDGVAQVRPATYASFQWGPDRYYDAGTKALYCYVDNETDRDRYELLKRVICDQTGADDIYFDKDNYDDLGIDHQSIGTSDDAFDSYDTLRNFIFNPKSYLDIDNDNH